MGLEPTSVQTYISSICARQLLGKWIILLYLLNNPTWQHGIGLSAQVPEADRCGWTPESPILVLWPQGKITNSQHLSLLSYKISAVWWWGQSWLKQEKWLAWCLIDMEHHECSLCHYSFLYRRGKEAERGKAGCSRTQSRDLGPALNSKRVSLPYD